MSHTTVIDKELDDEGVKIIDNLFNEEILKKDDENHKPKDVPAYHIDEENYSNEILNPKAKSEEEIADALKKSSLDEFVYSLPKGIETKVGESGIKLSGGQKQRLAIARAMLRKSKITIFDESTSSLDNIAQEHVKRSIDLMKGQSTIIIVAHRLSTIKNVDHIFFLDEGKIIDEGTFDELFNTNEKFKTMFLAENI